MSQRTCDVPECGRDHLARGYCRSHYNAWHYSGDALTAKVDAAPSRCIECAGQLPERKKAGPAPMYCSRSCRGRASWRNVGADALAKRRAANGAARIEKRCPCCGDTFKPEITVRQIYCSRRCSKRMQNANRRAKTRGAFVENVHWRMLYDEDGPTCHLCGLDTDPDDVGGLSYPTLDHVVPLASGGLHERLNTRLAHLYCNSVKGARPLTEIA